jgi:hypothetical protein
MELQPVTLPPHALADWARRHEVPPDRFSLDYPIQTALGPYTLKLHLTSSSIAAEGDRWVGGWLDRGGAAPDDASYSFELAAVKEGGFRELLGGGGSWVKGYEQGCPEVCEWSRLRRAVLHGCCRLQAACG